MLWSNHLLSNHSLFINKITRWNGNRLISFGSLLRDIKQDGGGGHVLLINTRTRSDSKKTTENRQFFLAFLCNFVTYARDTYACVRVSMINLSPWLTNKGTFTTKPVSNVAFLEAPVAVSPLIPGSVSVTSSSTLFGS